ncbi:MAG: F0F1 ATP synthase subunit epsilon [Deltaproteobacteria bacterium]|nr:F0F1 ATP synthase subunit epsilon [Deltaproteobacteria bacterium]
MKLKVFLPSRVLLEEEAAMVMGEGPNGSFGLKPRHVDFVTALVPGLLIYRPVAGGEDIFVAVDRGILVKRGEEVLVTVRNAVSGAGLEELAEVVAGRFSELDDRERQVRSALARLEIDFLRRFMKL